MPRYLTTTQRGLGWEHQQERARLLPLSLDRLCPYWKRDSKCTGLMRPGQPLDLDHVIPRVLGGALGPRRMSHARCNRRAGARLRHRLAHNSRNW